MAQTLACLRGWHVPLAQAELSALLPQTEFTKLSPRMAVSEQVDRDLLRPALDCAGGIQCFLDDAQIINAEATDVANLLPLVAGIIENFPKRGSLAVRYLRIAGRIDGLSTKSLAGQIGGIAVEHGFSIDLGEPDYEIGLIADGSSSYVACGWLVGDFDDSIGTATRRPTERPFFRPISLDPRLARLSVNLACGPVDERTVLDPMTGTGGFAMEAVTMGRNCLAIDMDPVMVSGTQQNVSWASRNIPSKADFQIICGDATKLDEIIPTELHGNISGVVLDPPYGRNSHGSQSHFDLISETISSLRNVVSASAKLVLIIPIKPSEGGEIDLLHGKWNDFSRMLTNSGAEIIDHWQEHVHGSLSRIILLATISPQD